MEIPKSKLQWVVKLSNGEKFTEGVGKFESIEGELSPWLKLKEYLSTENVGISALWIIDDEGRKFCLPDKENNPNFIKFEDKYTPLGFKFFRIFGTNLDPNAKSDYFSIIEVDYRHTKLQLWVEEKTKNCWALVTP